MSETIHLERLREEKYARVICYPNPTSSEVEKRVKEMQRLGIQAIEFSGKSTVHNLPILGKGHVGVVVLAHTSFGKTVLKIRRTDADRSMMAHEAEMLRKANSVNSGPNLKGFTDNLLMMEYTDGMLLPEWIGTLAETESKPRISRILHDLMEQSWRLDMIGLDHGELSVASKHIIVSPKDRAYILDFETASLNRKPSNVTSLSQYLFMRSKVARIVKKSLNEIEEKRLINALRNYKEEQTRERFEDVLRECKL